MQLHHLVTFMHVAELGNFTKAANQLGYTQSTVSFQIKQLEEELGFLLFERINHTITLTEHGRELVHYAHQIRALTDEFREKTSQEDQIAGHVRIVTPDSVCEEMVNSHYIDFHSKYPLVSIQFATGDTAMLLDILDHNEADIIITLDRHCYNKDYVIAKEEQLSMHFVTNAASKFAGKQRLSIRDIAGEPFVLTEHGQGYRRVLDRELAKKHMELTPVLEIGRTDMITSLLAKSDMISFLPDFATKQMVDEGILCYLDICDVNVEIWKQLIYHKNKWLSKSLKAVIDYIKENEFTN